VALLLVARTGDARIGGGMNFIHNDQVRTIRQELVPPPVTLSKVDADNQVGVIAIKADVAAGDLPLKPSDCTCADDFRMNVKMSRQFCLSLVAQVRRAQHAQSPGFTAVEQFARNQPSLDRLPNTYVVGNQ